MLIKALAAAAGNAGGGYTIDNSLRFNDNDSAYLSRTPSVAGNRKTWTWSGWVKRGNIGITATLFTSDKDVIRFQSDDTIAFFLNDGVTVMCLTNAVYRDTSGWYHIVATYDSTEATSSNRMKIYVNGIQQTFSSASYPSLNQDSQFNNTVSHTHGVNSVAAIIRLFDGYMAEVNFIDGQALTADDFGEINEDTGEWSPIAYEGTYGTNGFYLPFNGNANDSSGNGNNWTENNLAVTDYMIDTPTNNFAVLNPLASDEVTLQEGNLEATLLTTAPRSAITTMPVSSGKWYAEVYYNSNTGNALLLGVVTDSYSPVSGTTRAHQVSSGGGSVGYFFSDGDKFIDNVRTAYGSSATTGDILGIAFNLDDDEITFYKNNVSQGTITTKAFSGGYNFFLSNGSSSGNQVATLNQGADSSFAGVKTRQGNTDANGIGDFYYTPPAGYLALCTDNLAEPAIVDSETQFNVVTWTGTGSTQAITGVGFQPDFVWIKSRNYTYNHWLFDSVRGTGNLLASNTTDAEASYPTILSSFDSDGFTTDSNGSNFNFVAWCWKAGGTAVSNTDGSITSQVSANVDAGFSVVGHTGNGVDEATIGHGLSQAPDMIITKNRDSAVDWRVYHSSLPTDYLLRLNLTNAQATNVTNGWIHNVTSTTFAANNYSGIAGVNSSGVDYIHYCFHSVEGFSKFGSYTGNGSTNGPFVYTGFRPAFVIVKRTDAAGYNWVMFDSARDPDNVVQYWLYPNLSSAEAAANRDDMYSNGFKIRQSGAGINASGGTYIYMAFAESPTKFSLGR